MKVTRYFTTCNGATVQLLKPYLMSTIQADKNLVGEWPIKVMKGLHRYFNGHRTINNTRYAVWQAWVGTCEGCGKVHYAERQINRPAQGARNHKCDSRCLNAKGPQCDCSCGGKNHGAGETWKEAETK